MQPLNTIYAEETEIWMKKPSKQSCYTLSNYWTGWKSLLEISHSSYCCRHVSENRLVSLQTSHILRIWCWNNHSATSRVVCLTKLRHVPEWQKKPPATSGTNPQTLTKDHSACSQNTTIVFLPSDINPVPDTFGRKQEQPTKNLLSRKEFAAILTSSLGLHKNFKWTEKGKRLEITEIFLQNAVAEEETVRSQWRKCFSHSRWKWDEKRVIILRLWKLWGSQSRKNWWRKFR
jgi:hypothetical protein